MGDFSEVLSVPLKGLSVRQWQQGAQMSWPNHCSAPWPHSEQQFVLCWHWLAFSVHGFRISPEVRDNPQPLPFRHTTYTIFRMFLLVIPLAFSFLFSIHLPPNPPSYSYHQQGAPSFLLPTLGQKRRRMKSQGLFIRNNLPGSWKMSGHSIKSCPLRRWSESEWGPLQRNEVQWIDCEASWNIKEWTDFPQYLYTSLCGDFSLHWAWNC